MPFPQGALARPAHPLRLALARAVAPALALVGEFEADACARPPALAGYSRGTFRDPSGTRESGQSTQAGSRREPSSSRF